MNRFYRLLAYGYFPKELPPIFSTRNFARQSYNLSNIEKFTGNKWQRPSSYLLQQKSHYKRKLDIVCPQAFMKQAHLISENYGELQAKFTMLDGHCSRPAFNRKTKFQRAVRPFAIGRNYAQKKLKLCSRFPIILKIDIKNYYRSIYTHSIPWAIHGKAHTKNNLKADNLGNSLDRAFQQGQDGQTIGIPTGPDTSFLISELILCSLFESIINNRQIKKDRFVRYYDDIEYGCESEEEAYKILTVFENALREFELETNPDKVKIFSGLSHIESPWLFKLRELEWKKEIKTDLLLEIFSFVAELAKTYPEDHVFRYFLRKMRTSIVDEEAWDPYQRILLSILQENRGNAKEIYEQFSIYQNIGRKVNKKALKESLDRKISHQLLRGSTSELSWAIYGYLLFNLNMRKDLASKVLSRGDVPSKVLITMIIFDRNMSLKTDVNTMVRSWGDDVLNSSEWLLAYEIFVNKYHNNSTSVSLPKNSHLFEHLKAEGVSFLDSSILSEQSVPHAFKKHLTSSKEDDIESKYLIEADDIEGETSDDEIDGVWSPY